MSLEFFMLAYGVSLLLVLTGAVLGAFVADAWARAREERKRRLPPDSDNLW